MAAPDWQDLTRFALTLAHAAAQAILPHFRAAAPVDVKAGEVWDPVTEGDRAGERAIRTLIEATYPDHGIHGEEYGVKEGRSGFSWVLDPIDGTRAFIAGMPTWATLIGLKFEGRPMIGVMSQPWVGELFYGNPEGAWTDHRGLVKPLKTRQARPLADCILTTTAPELYRSAGEKAVLAALTKATRMTRFGGDAYFFCVMAAGQVDIAMDARMETYDIAPLVPIIAGAGGIVTTWDGGDPSNGGDIVSASTPDTHDDARAIIAQSRSG